MDRVVTHRTAKTKTLRRHAFGTLHTARCRALLATAVSESQKSRFRSQDATRTYPRQNDLHICYEADKLFSSSSSQLVPTFPISFWPTSSHSPKNREETIAINPIRDDIWLTQGQRENLFSVATNVYFVLLFISPLFFSLESKQHLSSFEYPPDFQPVTFRSPRHTETQK
ncbi:hypothetical protein DFS34DRAFT_609005 [Phlyctochytrium arcticum]|nr:hypothetical protein DFS34DRAFT_609005 [Phlyctochytrium arcticum]